MLCTCKHFKAILIALLFSFLPQEHLNIMLFELSQRLHSALSKVDISSYTSLEDEQSKSKESCVPVCDHMRPAKVLVVKKEGQNTIMTDILEFESPFGIIGQLFNYFFLKNYMKKFLLERNKMIKSITENP